jgi:signal transduction histidine kinase
MSEEQQNPLETARQLVGALRQQADGDLKNKLTEIDQLLAAAQLRGAGQDASELRQQIEEMITTTAQFNSVMVHEIRVPMTSIRGYADMLSKNVVGELNEMQMQFVETIRSNVIRMEHLVSDISDISKLKAGRLHFDTKMDMYKNIAMQAEKANAELAAAHNHTLTFETPDGLPRLNLDSTRLTQALNKLLVNALQYTPDGGQITVRAENVGGKLKVAVIDSGVGMSADELTHVGELFWRADNDLVRSFKGHGLGLPIAMGFVEKLGGEFFFQSEPDKGSTFGFVVPGMS